MSTFFLGWFHSCPLYNECFSEDCKSTKHQNIDIEEINLIKLVACIPILCGQIIGIVMFRSGLKSFQENSNVVAKVDGIANMFRGILTFLGLGIVCLLVDLLVTLALLVKKCLEKYC